MSRPFYTVWVLLTLLVLLVALPLCIWDFSDHARERAYQGATTERVLHAVPFCAHALLRPAWFVAGLFVLLAIPVSVYGIQVRARGPARRGGSPSP